jgi:hypothetical protein
MDAGFLAIESVIQARARQRESVKDKDTPFRVEFRFRHGTRHYQYFETYAAASLACDAACTYGPTGRAIVEAPRSQQVQIRGPRGGWKRAAIPEDALIGELVGALRMPAMSDEYRRTAKCVCGVDIEEVLDTPLSAGKFWLRVGTTEVCVDNHWHEPESTREIGDKHGE